MCCETNMQEISHGRTTSQIRMVTSAWWDDRRRLLMMVAQQRRAGTGQRRSDWQSPLAAWRRRRGGRDDLPVDSGFSPSGRRHLASCWDIDRRGRRAERGEYAWQASRTDGLHTQARSQAVRLICVAYTYICWSLVNWFSTGLLLQVLLASEACIYIYIYAYAYMAEFTSHIYPPKCQATSVRTCTPESFN